MRHVDFIRFFHKSHMALMSSEHLQAHRSTSGIFTGANGNNREVTTDTEDIRNAFELSISTISKDARFT